VHQPVVCRAQQHRVRKTGLAAGRPVFDMVGIDETRPPTPGESATFVPRPQGPPDHRRHDPRLATDTQRFAILILDDDNPVGVAGEPPHRFDR
jgi:hypothetical protein